MLGVALAYGGIAQFAAGMWEFRTGNTFGAVAFTSYGAFWVSFWALVTFFAADIPAEHAGAAIGLYLISWGIFTAYMFVASLRTTGAIALVFFLLTITFLLLGIGNSGESRRDDRSRRLGRAADRGRGLVRIVCGGGELDLRQDGAAGHAVGRLSRGRGREDDGDRRRSDRIRASSRSSSAMLEIEKLRAARGVPRAGAAGRTRRSTRRRPPTRSAWWTARSKELLDWDVEPTEGLERLRPSLLQVVRGRADQRLRPVPRPPRRGGRNGDRVAYHWRGEEGEERDVTYADLHRDVQRFANALKDLGVEQGRRGRDLPADDPRGRGGDAGLRPDRRASTTSSSAASAPSRSASGWNSPRPRR